MAKKKQSAVFVSFNLGDSVKIKSFAGKVGKIVEYRGALGPGGEPVFRVKLSRTPNVSYIELLGNQLEVVTHLREKPDHAPGKTRKTPQDSDARAVLGRKPETD
jgi:hypothetical protein